MLGGPLAGMAHADHPAAGSAELTPAVERALGPEAEETNAGVFKIPLDDGSVIRTHGPDLPPAEENELTAGGPGERFLPGQAERSPICATDQAMQVLYARTSTTADAFAASAPTIRSTVRRSNHILNEEAIASGGGGGDYKVVCSGDGAIDVQQFTTVGTSFDGVVNAARAAGFDSSARNYVIFLDASGGSTCGVGSLYISDAPGLSNPHNTNGGYALIYKGCWDGATFMHEVGHNRGAVQPAAPNSTGDGLHCNDGHDVMCYAPDGGDRNQSMTYPCSSSMLFDCNYDDYFDAAPEPGEYLATRWNLGTQGQNFLRITAAPESPGVEPTDLTPPQTAITVAPASKSRRRVTFRFAGTDETSASSALVFECALDGAAYAPCSSPVKFRLSAGRHSFRVRAIDEAQNTDATPATHTWKVRRKRR